MTDPNNRPPGPLAGSGPRQLLALGSVLAALAILAGLGWAAYLTSGIALPAVSGEFLLGGGGRAWSMHPDLCEIDDGGAIRFYDDQARPLRLAILAGVDGGRALAGSAPGSTEPTVFAPSECSHFVLTLDAGAADLAASALSGKLEARCPKSEDAGGQGGLWLGGQLAFERCR